MAAPITIFTDRDGDTLSVVPRNESGNTSPDPVLTVTYLPGKKGQHKHSVVFTEKDVPDIVVKMVGSLHLSVDQIAKIIKDLGNLIDSDVVIEFR